MDKVAFRVLSSRWPHLKGTCHHRFVLFVVRCLNICLLSFRPGHTVADFGCGDAKIAQSVSNKVHSFDLVALNEFVTPCDMAHVSCAAGTLLPVCRKKS